MKIIKKKHYLFFLILLALLSILSILGVFYVKSQVYIPSFVVTGDVQNVLKIDSMRDYNTESLTWGGSKYRVLVLSELIEQAIPYTEDYHICIQGDDELIAVVDGDQIDGMHIAYTKENGWEMMNSYHPPTSNIKRITQIWIVADGVCDQIGVSIITKDKNIACFTPGQFYFADTDLINVFEGKSNKLTDDHEYAVSAYTQRKVMYLSDLNIDIIDVLVMGEEGAYQYDSGSGRIELSGNQLNYVCSDEKTTIENVRGVLLNPPAHSTMDTFDDALNALDHDQKVMIILTDGFSYHQYTYAKKHDYAPCLVSIEAPVMASTVYKPVTYAGLAAILTGQSPELNGVYQSKMPDLLVDDIFYAAEQLGKTSVYIEGNIKILNTSIDPILNTDKNSDGTVDDEILSCALQQMENDYDLVFVHFHGIDDQGHKSGDLSEDVLQRISETDGYIDSLLAQFKGTVIITSDHGMHATADGGAHGLFRYEDMIVPYFNFEVEH